MGVTLDDLDELTRRSSAAVDEALDSNQNDVNLRLQLTSDWIQQERFNIQEAFTNQTRKLQMDFQSCIAQLDDEFERERAKILGSSVSQCSAEHQQCATEGTTTSLMSVDVTRQSPSCKQTQQQTQMEKQFQSNTKRDMFVHTAPVMDPRSGARAALQALPRTRSSSSKRSKHRANDTSETQKRLDALLARLQAAKEVRAALGLVAIETLARCTCID